MGGDHFHDIVREWGWVVRFVCGTRLRGRILEAIGPLMPNSHHASRFVRPYCVNSVRIRTVRVLVEDLTWYWRCGSPQATYIAGHRHRGRGQKRLKLKVIGLNRLNNIRRRAGGYVYDMR